MYLIALLILAMAVSLDSFSYGMIYKTYNIKVKGISLLLLSLSGWVTLILFGAIGELLAILLPIILAKTIAIIALLICSVVILKDIVTYKRGTLRGVSGEGQSFYMLGDKSNYDNFSKLIYYPLISKELREMKILEGLSLGVIMNLDGGVVMLVLGIMKGEIILPSIIFTLLCLNSYKLGNILVKKDFINRLK
ncbi:hypothetical protein U472_13025 [Orenia metallireducens]|uniref:Sporulation protein YtaF n=1 Tax=Orenia metallireducens TaxID=1413210 RepID=A0A1C0A593_9FIRM|nr:hypothetical protein [Orenia metallireducens]OCL25276.1 hypothetical protein U472_13025 [Orenia metallireducens]